MTHWRLAWAAALPSPKRTNNKLINQTATHKKKPLLNLSSLQKAKLLLLRIFVLKSALPVK